MAIICTVDSRDIVKEEPAEGQEVNYDIYFGVFFDGTSNNMIQCRTARMIRRNHAKNGKQGFKKLLSYGWCGKNRHKYEKETLNKTEEKIIDETISEGSFKDGYEGPVIKDGGFSNIAILFSRYQGAKADSGQEKKADSGQEKIADSGQEKKADSSQRKILVYKIYVEGSGANDMKSFSTGSSVKGLGFGVSKTGVVALVSKAVSAVESILLRFQDGKNVSLHFDVFGFSRGAACARLFAYLVRRQDDNILQREGEFGKYYCKDLYGGKNGKGQSEERLYFLKDYSYVVPMTQNPSGKTKGKTKEISFLGIFDTVVSIGFLRRKKNPADESNQSSSNKFWDKKNNSINPLRVVFSGDDFKENLHDLNASEYGMFSPQLGVPTFHICAMDEFRENFALTDVGQSVPDNSFELFLPGCHSDIGGGYICNNEEKIVLNKFPLLKKECAKIFVSNPQCEPLMSSDDEISVKPLGLDSIRELGWLPNKEEIGAIIKTPLFHDKVKKNFNPKIEDTNNNEDKSNKVQGNHGDKEGKFGQYEWWDKSSKIGWKRIVPSFFSNVTLHLMATRASIVTNRKMFVNGDVAYKINEVITKASVDNKIQEGTFWASGYYDIPLGLKQFYAYILASIDLAKDKGCRKFVFPGGQYSSEDYRYLRLNYLHFTSEQTLAISRVWDVQNATTVNGYNNVITRIVYHADQPTTNGKSDDSGNMHYMYNYNVQATTPKIF